jgi:MFS family permease
MVLRTPSQPAQAPQALQPAEATGRSWLMLAVLLLGQFMCLLDVFVVNVAMPAIGTGLHASGASLQLVVGGYTIAYAMLLITGARLGDRFGRRRIYLAGVIIFTAASLACALAPDSQILIAFRFVQGAGAAVLIPQVFSIIQLTFSGQARAKALSAYAAVISAGAVAGLVLGGVLLVVLPFALAAAGLGLGLSVGPLLTQALAHVPPARAADASGLLTTTVQLGQLMGVAVLGSVYLSRAATHQTATHAAAAMSGTAAWLAALSAAGLPAALVMMRGVSRRSASS